MIAALRRGFQKVSSGAEQIERSVRSLLSISRIAENSLALQRKESESTTRISAAFSQTWNVVFYSRILWDIGEFATLAAFVKVDGSGKLVKNIDGTYKWRGWAQAIGRILLCVSRALCLTLSFHDLKAYRLAQKHVSRISISIATIWSAISVGALYTSISNALATDHEEEERYHYVEVTTRLFDVASLTFDLFSKSNAVCGVVSGVLNLLAGIFGLIREINQRP